MTDAREPEPQRAFGEGSPEEIEQAFLIWAAEAFRARWPEEDLDLTLYLGTGGERDVVPLRPTASLEPAEAAPLDQMAIAVGHVHEGRAALGLSILDLLAERGGGEHERILQEKRRVEAWIRMRDGFLQRLQDEGPMLQFDYAGKRGQAKIESVRDGVVLLEPNRLGVRSVEVEALAPLDLARQMSKRVDGLGEPWVRLYPYVLAGDARWKRLLKEDGGEGDALRAQAVAEYPALLRTARAAGALGELAATGDPADGATARAQIDLVRDLISRFGDVDLVERKRPALRALARRDAAILLDLEGPAEALGGTLEELPDDRLRITYDFASPAELGDFEEVPYLDKFREGLAPLDPSAETGYRIEEGELRATGKLCLRSLYQLGAPITAVYRVRLSNPFHVLDPSWDFSLGICDDGRSRFAWANNINYLQVWDGAATTAGVGGMPQLLFDDVAYELEVRHDGERIVLSCDGEEMQHVAAGDLAHGAFFLWLHTDMELRVDSLEIEGQRTPGCFQRLEAGLVDRWTQGI